MTDWLNDCFNLCDSVSFPHNSTKNSSLCVSLHLLLWNSCVINDFFIILFHLTQAKNVFEFARVCLLFICDFLFACVCTHVYIHKCTSDWLIVHVFTFVPVHMCVFGRVLGVCMLGGTGIRNRLRGNWTAGRRMEGEAGVMGRLVSSGSSSLWHDYSVPLEQVGHQLVCRGLKRGKKWIIFLSPECICVSVSVLHSPYAAAGGLQEHTTCRAQEGIYLSIWISYQETLKLNCQSMTICAYHTV